MTTKQILSLEKAIKLGIECHGSGRLEEAYQLYQFILKNSPNNTQILHLLGVLAMQTNNSNAAMQIFSQVLVIDPDHVNALYHSGVIQRERLETEIAMASFRKVLEIDPSHIEARSELGMCLQKLDYLDEAVEQFNLVLDKNPSHLLAAGNIVTLYMHSCQWKELENYIPIMDRLNKQAIKDGSMPGEILSCNIARIDNPKINLQMAECHSKKIEKTVAASRLNFNFASRKNPTKKLTIGYLCNNFNNHPTGHLICRLFEKHDRNKFNIIAYSHGGRDEYYYPIIKAGCDSMVDITAMADQHAAQKIYADGVDILIDLKGHTPEARLGIFAHRPAPVQITYLGFPGTSGAKFFDYIITDKVVSPPHHKEYYSEQFFYMPDCYQINDSEQKISDKTFTRADMGLPENAFVFSSFNQCYKIDPVMFDVWCRILEKTPGSVLWLLDNNKAAVRNLKIQVSLRGIDQDRVIFAELFKNKAEHLARVKLADLALDTRICGGHTTSSDMLWAGVPVVTMLGKHFASRVCSSLLTAIGLPQLITNNLEEYENLCLKLASNPEALLSLKQILAENRLTKPLFDTEKFTHNLEKGYQEAWDRFVNGDSGKKPIVIS